MSLLELLHGSRTLVMGVINVTPDSFSDGGRYDTSAAAIDRGLRLLDEGADILDVGGESTAPASDPVPADEECRRVMPVIEALAESGARVSVDTSKAGVARRALDAGAQMINDVTALRGDPGLASVVASAGCPVALMYSKDATPRTTLEAPHYDDVVSSVKEFLLARVRTAESAGIGRDRIVVDTGMGAFVSSEPGPSLEILRRLDEICALGFPVLIGASRKGFIGRVLGLPVDDRLEGSLACAAVAAWSGARIIRVHDVQATVRTVRMADAIARGV